MDVTAQMRALEALQQAHAERGVRWGFGFNQLHRRISFHSFERDKSRTVPGDGMRCLLEVCSLADQLQLPLYLWTNHPKLYAYYESAGFHETIDSQIHNPRDAHVIRDYIRPYQAPAELRCVCYLGRTCRRACEHGIPERKYPRLVRG